MLDINPEENQRIQKFKEAHIYREVVAAEIERHVFSEWADFNANARWDKKKEESDAEVGMTED